MNNENLLGCTSTGSTPGSYAHVIATLVSSPDHFLLPLRVDHRPERTKHSGGSGLASRRDYSYIRLMWSCISIIDHIHCMPGKHAMYTHIHVSVRDLIVQHSQNYCVQDMCSKEFQFLLRYQEIVTCPQGWIHGKQGLTVYDDP